MLLPDFEKLCQSLNDERRKILVQKRPEYTEGHEDVLKNFKQTAQELNLDPMQVAYVFFRKHVASIGQVCTKGVNKSSEPFGSRISDAMNYLELIYALHHERQVSDVMDQLGHIGTCTCEGI